MKLSIRTKLIGHSCVIVFVTVLMSTLASVYLSRDQIREQNQSRLDSAAFRFDRLIYQNIKDLDDKFMSFSSKTGTTGILLNCIQQDFFYFPSLPDLFEMVPEMGLDRYAFYFGTRLKGPDVLQIYFDKKLGGLIRVRTGTHSLHIRKGSEIVEEHIADPGIFPETYLKEVPYELQSSGKVVQIMAHLEYINLADASAYGSTFKKGERIGYFFLEKPLTEDLDTLDREMGVHVNVYDRRGRLVGGQIQMQDLYESVPLTEEVIALVDQKGEKYDSILKAVSYRGHTTGYASFSIPQSTTKAKLLDTVRTLAVIGIIAAILGISGAFVVNSGIVIPINRLVHLVRKVADGDLSESGDTRTSDLERSDEIGTMVNDMMKMTDRIREVLREIDGLIQSVEEGNLSIRGNERMFSGAWQELVIGINNVLDAFIEPFNRTSSYIDRISVGDIPQKITEPYKGDFNTIIVNLNMLIDATNEATGVAEAIAGGNAAVQVRERSAQDRMMQALNAMVRRLKRLMQETDDMIRAVGEGRLDVRAKAEAFDGGWRDLITGINNLIDDLSAELQRQMEELERFKSLLDQSHDAIFLVDAFSGRLADVNRTACQCLGYAKEELLRLSISDIIEKDVAKDVLESFSSHAKRTNMQNPVITILRTCQGDGIPAEISMQFVGFAGKSYVVGVARDITDRKKAEADILAEKAKAEMYFDTAAVMLLVLNTAGEVTKINKKGCKVLGCDEKDIVGKDWFTTFTPFPLREQLRRKFQDLLCSKDHNGEEVHVISNENTILTGSGEERIIVWNNSRLRDERGAVVGTLSSGEDITDRRFAEEERERLNTQLRQFQKMESLGTLAGGIAHDFNNLLTPILGYSEMILNEVPKGDRTHNRLGKVLTAANRAKDLIQQILTFARQTEEPYRPMVLQPIVKEVLKLLRATLPASIEMLTDIDAACGSVMGDPTQIHQIIMNLCTNAYHTMREKGGVLEVKLGEVEISPADSSYFAGLDAGSYVRMTVADSGMGMEAKILDRIFEPYFTTKQREGGTGLGLAVVHGIVKQMKGHISIYSEPGMGTTFNIYFPRVRPGVMEQAQLTASAIPGGRERILLVDDEPLVLDMIREMLELMGYEVTAHLDSIEALATFRNKPHDYDLVITDMSMPGMTGTALSQAILKGRPDIPIIICTGFSELITEESVTDMGVRGFIMKPVVTKDLAKAVRRALSGF